MSAVSTRSHAEVESDEMIKDPEAHARIALTAFVRRSLVLVVFARQGERTPHHGSGTLVVGGSRRIGILTAGHLVQAGDLISLVTTGAFVQDAVDEVVHAPERLDVALAFLRESVSSQLRQHALPVDRLEQQSERRIHEGSMLIAAGFPEQFTYDAHHPSGTVQHRFADILNYTSDFTHDDRTISIAWKQGQITGDAFPYDDLAVPRDRAIQFRKPTGLSGGPVYLVRATREDMLWSPSGDATLIGVATEFTVNRREQALPWWRWSNWVADMLK